MIRNALAAAGAIVVSGIIAIGPHKQQHPVAPAEVSQQQQEVRGQLPCPEDTEGLPMTPERAAFDGTHRHVVAVMRKRRAENRAQAHPTPAAMNPMEL